MTVSKVSPGKAKAAKLNVKSAPAKARVEAAAEAKLLADAAHEAAIARAGSPVDAAEGAGGNAALILGGVAVLGGLAAAAAGGGGDDITVTPAPVTVTPAPTPPPPTYTVSAVAPATGAVVTSVDEGATVRFNIAVTNPTTSTQSYKIEGVSADDLVDPSKISGSVQLGSDGKAYVDIAVKADVLTDGAEAIKITVGTATASVNVNDTSVPVPVTQKGYALTTGADVAEANIFSSARVLVAGTGYINTLDDDDVLTGAGVKPTLNVSLGSETDIISLYGTEIIQPTLNKIEQINIEWQGTNSSGFYGGNGYNTVLDLADADSALATVNVDRVTVQDGAVGIIDLSKAVTNVAVADATRGGRVDFDWREDELTSSSNALNLTISNARLHDLRIIEGGDSNEDRGSGFETINIKVSGASDIDNLVVAINADEDKAEANANQVINVTADKALEVNSFDANGAEEMSITANAAVVIAANPKLVLQEDLDGAGNGAVTNDGIHTSQLRKLTITGSGDVTIDGLNGHVDESAADASGEEGTTLVVAAGAMTGALKLGVQSGTGADGNVSTDWENRVDKDVSITSGSGNDRIEIYGALAGDVTTNAGDDVVSVNNGYDDAVSAVDNKGETYGNLEGVSAISTGAGNDGVYAAALGVTATDHDETGNDGYDDVNAASISTGSGDDIVKVTTLASEEDWDNGSLVDSNVDDTYVIKGASVDTGDGIDSVTFSTLAENATVKTGAGNDTVTAELGATGSVLAADTDANYTVKGNTADTAAVGTIEFAANGSVDALGAVIDLGEGDDVIAFTDKTSAAASTANTIVDIDAELRGGAGTKDTLNVTALDTAIVAAAVDMGDKDPGVTGVQADVNALITGIETINLTVANQVEDDGGASALVNETLNNAVVNDDADNDGGITLDVRRVDSDLKAINLVSAEQAMLKNPSVENYEVGTATSFTLNNLRSAVEVTLSANEASGVTNNDLKDDATTDVIVDVSATYAEAVKADTSFTLNLLASGNKDQAAYDVELNSAASLDKDGGHKAATSLTDDDDLLIEKLVINLGDKASHAFDLAGFDFATGDSDNGAAADTEADATKLDKATSLKIGTTVAGSTITATGVGADKVEVLGAADVKLTVVANGAYDITTGSGADIINMVATTVDEDSLATAAYNEQDKINAGDGTDRLVVDGNDKLGNYDTVTANSNDDDEIFIGLKSIEEIEVRTNGADSTEIVLDDDAYATGVKALIVAGTLATDDQTLKVGIGRDFERDLSITANGKGSINFEVDNDGNANLAIVSDADDGATFTFADAGKGNTVNLTLNVNDAGVATTVSSGAAGAGTDGSVKVTVTDGSIDKITLTDKNVDTDKDGKFDVGESDNGDISVVVDNDWLGGTVLTGPVAFTVDASGIDNFDLDADGKGTVSAAEAAYDAASWGTGGAFIDGRDANLYSALTLLGTANSDTISGGNGLDTVTGNDGNDVLQGDAVIEVAQVDTVTFAATYDRGDEVELTINGETLTATVGATGTVTGDAIAAAFADFSKNASDTKAGDNISVVATGTAGSAYAISDANGADGLVTVTGSVAGDRTAITASVDNGSDVAGSAQTQTITPTDWEATESLQVSVGGVTYTTEFVGDLQTSLAKFVTDHETAIETASGGSLAATATTLTLTGAATGASMTSLVQFGTITGGDSGSVALAIAAATDVVSDQANPTVTRVTSVNDGSIYRADTLNGGAGNDHYLINVSGGGLVANSAATVVAGAAGADGTVTFNATYNADDKITLVIAGQTFSHTVVAGKTAGTDVAAAFLAAVKVATFTDVDVKGATSSSAAEVLTIDNGTAGTGAFTVTSTLVDAKVVTSSIDTIVGLNLGSTAADVDQIGLGVYLDPGAATVDSAGALSVTQIVNNGAAVAMTGATLEAAIDSLFQSNGVFQTSSSSATNAAGLFTYGDDTYLVAVGSTSGVFGNDDAVVKVTGYTGTLSVSDFTSIA